MKLSKNLNHFHSNFFGKLPFKFWIICFSSLFNITCNTIFLAFMTDLLVERYSYSAVYSGRLTSIVFFVSIISGPISGFLLGKFNRILYFIGTGILLILGSLSLIIFTDFPPIISLSIFGFAYGLLPSCIWPSVSFLVTDEQVGTAYGILTAIGSAGFFAFPYLFGKMHDYFKSYHYPTVAIAGVNLLGFLLWILLYVVDIKDDLKLQRGIRPDPEEEAVPLMSSSNHRLNF